MEIMKKVADHVRRKNHYLFVFILFIINVMLLLEIITGKTEFPSFSIAKIPVITEKNQWFWFFPWLSTFLANICIWLYYAPIVVDSLNDLKDAFSDEQYKHLYKNYNEWMMQFNIQKTDRSQICKIVYFSFWFTFLLAFYIYTWPILITAFSNPVLALLSNVLVTTLTILNFSSYYICMIFVYFLIRICHLNRNKTLPHIEELPSATYGLQLLNHTANTIYLYFLLDSLLCTISYSCFWYIISYISAKNNMIIDGIVLLASKYVTFFLIVFGLVSWIIIILFSRTYLHKLHDSWKLQSLKKLEEEYQSLNDPDARRDHIISTMDKLSLDKISMGRWELIISFATLAADLATAVSILNLF